jgi:hypothetical protein
MLKRNAINQLLAAGLAISLIVSLHGCSLDLLGLMTPLDDSQGQANVEVTEGFVQIRFRNLLVNEAVDVQFHVADTTLSNLPEDLFAAEHLMTASIGVAGTGIIQPQKLDIIELPCTENLTIGTQGGRFTDNESGEPRGTGTPRWIQEGPVALCGSIVTFEFAAGDGDGEFTTTLSIGY